jgi:protein ImuA
MSALEALLAHPGIWRGRETGSAAVPTRPSGFAQLDQALRGGWPRGQLTELIGGALRLRGDPDASARTGLVHPGAAPGGAGFPPGRPWAPGWRQMGVDPELLLLIRAATEDDAVWSSEQILRQPGTGALLVWLRGADGAPLRRLRLATGTSDACVFLYRPAAAAQQPSPAHLRIRWQGSGDHLRLEVIKQTGGWLPRNQPVMIPRSLLNHRCDP